MKNVIIVILLFFCFKNAVAQNPQTIVEKKSIYIGEQFYVFYKLNINKGDSIQYTPYSTSFEGEIKTKKKDSLGKIDVDIIVPFQDSIFLKQDKLVWVGKYKVTLWDSGSVIIPSTTLLLNDSLVTFPSFEMQVDLAKHIEGKDIYDIKEEFTELPDVLKSLKNFFADNWIWIVTIVLLIAIIVFILLRRKKKKELALILSLEELAIQAIQDLNKKKLWLSGNLKQHYIELSFILRDYLSKKLALNLLKKTTVETTLLLKGKEFSSENIKLIEEILMKSDMVKFAKSLPEEYEILRTSNQTIDLIKEVEIYK